MSDDGTVPDWAKEIAERRQRLIWTQSRLAREMREVADPEARAQLPSRESMIRRITSHENGVYPPKPLYAELYRRVWSKWAYRLSELEGSEDAVNHLGVDPLALTWTVGRLNQRVDRRTLLQLAAVAAAGSSALDPVERLMRSLSGHTRPDAESVKHLEDRTKGFHRLEEHWPAKKLYPALQQHLGEISSLLETTRSDDLRTRLAVAAGESAVLVAWMAWELGDRDRAESSARLAGFAAREGNDPAAAACMTGYQTYMTGGDHRAGVKLASNALERIGDADLATRAWLLARKGEESALLGDRQGALEAIREAEDVYAIADINARPWTCFLDPARFASMTLSVYSRIKQENLAMAACSRVSKYLGPEPEIKKLCVVQADMALAQYRLRDVEEAVRHARSALEATTAMAAPLGWDRLDHVVRELSGSKTQVANKFRAEYGATRPKSAPPSLL